MEAQKLSIEEFAMERGITAGAVRKLIARRQLPDGYTLHAESARRRWIVKSFDSPAKEQRDKLHQDDGTRISPRLGRDLRDSRTDLEGFENLQGLEDVRKRLDLMIVELHNKACEKNPRGSTSRERDKPLTITHIEALAQANGLRGYDRKSVYRKLKKLETNGTLSRKMRSDKFGIRQQALSSGFGKLKMLATAIYFDNAQPNISILCDLIKQISRVKEEYWEFANIPKATMYRQLSIDFKQSGYGTLHQYFNHYNLFAKTMPTVSGAFTNDIGFMDYITGDDHKADIASVFVYDELLKKVVQKQVKIWLWIEEKTMYPLGWVVKVGEITQRDLIQSLTKIIMQYGLPNIDVKVDNGIGRGTDFRDFISKLYLGEKAGPRFTEPYSPTQKATVERCFRLFKDEHDCFMPNYVGPDKERESRHSGQALSPEECELFLDEYRKSFETYLNGFYIDKERKRVINGTTQQISTKAYFDLRWRLHSKREVSEQTLRYALSHRTTAVYKHEVVIKKMHFLPADVLPLGILGETVQVVYNPDNMSAVDIYALKDFVDRPLDEGDVTRVLYRRGQYIATLHNIEQSQRREHVNELKKRIKKQVKELAQNATALTETLSLSGHLPGSITSCGTIVEERKQIQQRHEALLEQSVMQLPGIAQREEFTQTPEKEEYDLDLLPDTINN